MYTECQTKNIFLESYVNFPMESITYKDIAESDGNQSYTERRKQSPEEPLMPKATTPADRKDKLTRTERKDLTRSSLMQAALALMGEGRSFTSLGIREIAREAGMVPNGFYRHFRSTDDLGLALVEEVGITLRRLLREVRQNGVEQSEVTRRSEPLAVSVYFKRAFGRQPHPALGHPQRGNPLHQRNGARFSALGHLQRNVHRQPANGVRPHRHHHACGRA